LAAVAHGRRELLQPGTPFLFKLHYPANVIVGGGFFVRFSVLPARLAWEAFSTKNGTLTYADLKSRIASYREIDPREDPQIGCNVLCEPFFWDEPDCIPAPASWKPNIVKGKTFDTSEREGQDL
jgi:putative restriction endonuclease